AFTTIADAVEAARRDPRREIEISCLGTFALKWLIPRLSGFMAAHPDIRVRFSESYAPIDFFRSSADGAIRIFDPGPPPDRQEATPFMSQYQGPVGAPALVPPGITLEAMGRLPRLRASTFRESWRIWSDLVGVRLPAASQEREFQHNNSMIEAAVA